MAKIRLHAHTAVARLAGITKSFLFTMHLQWHTLLCSDAGGVLFLGRCVDLLEYFPLVFLKQMHVNDRVT